jgi:hypothetical protein
MRRGIAFWLGSLVLVALLASSLTLLAQTPVPRQWPLPNALSRIVSGPDVGFRVEGTDPRSGNPTGTWMIRVNGEWMEAAAAPSYKPVR